MHPDQRGWRQVTAEHILIAVGTHPADRRASRPTARSS